MRQILGAIASLWLAVLCASARDIMDDPGGKVFEYIDDVTVARAVGEDFRILGHCNSACTLYLALAPDHICVGKQAMFAFHRVHGGTPTDNEAVTRFMYQQYPEWVQDWLEEHGWLTDDIKIMTYEYASKHIPTC